MAGDAAQDSSIRTKRSIKKDFYVFFLGVFFSFSAFRATLDLQTSINIQHGLGAAAGFVNNGLAVLSSLTIAPVVLNKLGPRKTVILCEIFYLLFIAANYYAVFATVIPASVLSGIGDALIFPAMSVFSVFHAVEYSKLARGKHTQYYVHEFAGKYFGVVYLTKMSGNIISYVVLKIDAAFQSGNATSLFNKTTHEIGAFCGANDCQDPNITEKYLSSYVVRRITIYILLAIFVSFLVIAILIHFFGATDVHHNEQTIGNNGEDSVALKRPIIQDTLETTDADEIKIHQKDNGQTATKMIVRTFGRSIRQIKDGKQLLLAGVQLYAGLSVGFVVAEISRAYLSCMLGVQQTGLGMTVFGSVACFSSYVNGKLAACVGRNVPLFIAFAIDFAGYIFCLQWKPTLETTWVVYVICAAYGYSNGAWQSLTNAMVASYFKRDQEVAYTIWNFFLSCGITLQFGWSTYLCVYVKLTASLVILCIASALYGIAEFKYHRKARSPRAKKTSSISAERNQN